MPIRPARPDDAPAIAAIILPVIRAGETYALDPAMSEGEAIAYWLAADKTVFVAEEDGVLLGTYYLRANQAGGGDHVANAGYMTSAASRGRGVARAMALHSFDEARARGFAAMRRKNPTGSGEGGRREAVVEGEWQRRTSFAARPLRRHCVLPPPRAGEDGVPKNRAHPAGCLKIDAGRRVNHAAAQHHNPEKVTKT